MPRTAAFTIVGGAQIMLPTPHREEWSSSVLLRVTALSSEVVWLRLKQNERSSSKDFKHTRSLMRLSNSISVGYLSPVIFGALLPVLSHRRLHDRARREDLIKLRRMLGTDPTVTTRLRKIAELHLPNFISNLQIRTLGLRSAALTASAVFLVVCPKCLSTSAQRCSGPLIIFTADLQLRSPSLSSFQFKCEAISWHENYTNSLNWKNFCKI